MIISLASREAQTATPFLQLSICMRAFYIEYSVAEIIKLAYVTKERCKLQIAMSCKTTERVSCFCSSNRN